MRAATKVTGWTTRVLALLVPFAALLLPSSARADEPAKPPPEPASAGAPAPPGSAAAAGEPSASPPAAGAPLGFIERLPPGAYPTDPVRGIYGGSLWSTFHGQQWPYYPKTGIGVSGYIWVDSGYEHIARGNTSAEQGTAYWLQQGRLVLRVTPTWSDGNYFVQAQAELVGNKDQTQAPPNINEVDDLWIKAGQWKAWDVQIGRYEGWEVYHFGMGLDLYTLERNGATDTVYTVPSIYGVTYAFYRPAGIGNAALHVYPTKNLRFELGTQYGNQFGSNGLAARPVAVYDLGWLKLKAGAEYVKLTDQADGSQGQTTERGAGLAAQVVVDPWFEAGINGAYGLVDNVSSSGQVSQTGSFKNYSYGAFANARVVGDFMLGAGYNYTWLEDIHYDATEGRPERFSHTQTFAAAQYIVAKKLFIKLVGAYALGQFAPTFNAPLTNNNMFSLRLRLQFLF
jgi:hypothetical protein